MKTISCTFMYCWTVILWRSDHFKFTTPHFPQCEHPPIPPPYSCRSGLSVCLMANTDDGIQPRPYKLKVKTEKRAEEITQIMLLEKTTMEQVLRTADNLNLKHSSILLHFL